MGLDIDQIHQVSNQSENDDIPEKANCNLRLLFISPYYLTRNSTNGSAVKWSRDTGGDT